MPSHGFAPVLLETFVEEPWVGTCYAAANWQRLGDTTGRGRTGGARPTLPRKSVWVYPVIRDWRAALVAFWPVYRHLRFLKKSVCIPQWQFPVKYWLDWEKTGMLGCYFKAKSVSPWPFTVISMPVEAPSLVSSRGEI